MRRSLSSERGVAFAVLLSAAVSLRLSGQAIAPEGTQNAGGLFLLFPVGARAVGMGQSAVALDGGGEAVFWNPSGLATMENGEFALHSASLVAGATNALTAFFPRRGIGVLGGAVYLVDYGDQDVVDSTGTTVARLAPRNIELLASFATDLGGSFAFGLSYKLVEFRVDCSGDCHTIPAGIGVTHALGVGGQFTIGETQALRVGFVVRNIGFPLQVNNRDQADPLPARLVLGALYRIDFHPFPGGDGKQRLDLKVAADVESPWGEVGTPQARLGFDVGYQRLLRLRGGYAFVHEGLGGPSVGLGVASGSIGVDLAHPFLTGSSLVTANPTYLSFRVTF